MVKIAEAPVEAVTAVPAEPALSEPRTLDQGHRAVEFERRADATALRAISSQPEAEIVPARWLNLRLIMQLFLGDLTDRWSVASLLGAEQTAGDELRGGDVLDGETDRLEDGDGVGSPALRPGPIDGPDLHEVFFRH